VQSIHRHLIGLSLVLLAAWSAYHPVLDLELMGWDTYPLIAASRIQSLGDFLGSFTEELMDGRYPEGHFYRPVTNLSFALDHAVWGLDPFGYHVTALLILAAAVVSVYVLAQRWFGGVWAPLVAAAVFALHPLQLETLPVPARRGDMLFSLFVLWALIVQPRGKSPPARAGGLSALWVVLAAASKETGAIALPLIAAYQFLLDAEGTRRQRTRRALAASALPAAGFALYLAARTAVLGGLGGHPGSSLLTGVLRGLRSLPEYAQSLLVPQPWSDSLALGPQLLTALVVGLLLALMLLGMESPPSPSGARPDPRRSTAFLGIWLLGLLAMTGISGERASWYAVPYLAPYALLIGGIANGAAAAARKRHIPAALAAGGIALVLAGSHLRYSGLIHHYAEWDVVSRQERLFLERFRAALHEAAPGTTIVVPDLPLGTGEPMERVGIRSALCLSDYSVEAYAALVAAELPVRVMLRPDGTSTPPLPDVVTVDVIPLPSPVLRRPDPASG
jgi:hypothetical protein